jgi:uncharacterized damage-inducible protein DinB
MKLTETFLADLDRELPATRRVLANVPDGRFDWKPHENSMPLGYLAMVVATMPEWIGMVITMDELDIAPKGGSSSKPAPMKTAGELVAGLDAAAEKGRAALRTTTDAHLMASWKLLSGGRVMQETPRHVQLRDGILNHWVHHRGQLSVYLRLTGAKVPWIYGPSGDEQPPMS